MALGRDNGRGLVAPSAARSDVDPLLMVTILGPVRASFAGQELRLRSRKGRALLAYLALQPGGEETRERMVGLLWSEFPEEKARASLRQVVHELRGALQEVGCHGQAAERSVLRLPRACGVDVEELVAAVATAVVPAPLLEFPRLHERLMLDCDDLDPAFQVWLTVRRQAYFERIMRGLDQHVRNPSAGHRLREDAARAALLLDPTNEEACRTLMRLLAETGDAIGAIRAYDALWQVLSDDFDTEPAEATQLLVAAIKTGQIAPEATSLAVAATMPTAVPAASLRIALLIGRFEMNGVPAERAHLVTGFRYDLISRLVRFREWYVVDGADIPTQALGTRVSTCFRISATAYQAGERISMVIILAEADAGIMLWSERVELAVDGWFAAQGHVLRRIAIALNAQISAARLAVVAVQPDVSVNGYDRWLRCQSILLQFNADDWGRAFAMLEELTSSAPGFAPAWSSLAQLDNVAHITRAGVWRDRQRELRSLRHAQEAVRADPNDSRSQLCLAWSLIMMGRNAQADVPVALALDLNPDDSWLLISASQIHAFQGRHETAAALARQSLEATLVPSRAHWVFQAANAFFAGDDPGVLDACEQAQDGIKTAAGYRAAALHWLGKRREARAAAARFCELVRAGWVAEEPPTEAAIARWFLHLFPLRRAADWARLRDGIAGAGLPTAGCAHGAWYR